MSRLLSVFQVFRCSGVRVFGRSGVQVFRCSGVREESCSSSSSGVRNEGRAHLHTSTLPHFFTALAIVAALFIGGIAKAQGPPQFVPGRVLVKFNPRATAQQVRSLMALARSRDAGVIPGIGVHVIQLPDDADEMAMANAFANRPEVSCAELDAIRPVQDLVPNDTYYSNQWHLPKIGAPAAWSTTTGSMSVIIAICDTGCDPTHPDLQSKYVPGWNFYDNNSDTHDVYGHGTFVAGLAGAAGNNGIGVAGVCWGAKIMPCRISDVNGSATYSAMASALTWAADHGARVANISYIATDSSTVTSAAQYFQSKGGVVTVSAGNYSTFDATADNPYILTVSATDSNDVLASWSNTGNNVDLTAPGVNVYSTANGGAYGSGSGTSFSAPIVAGVAALVISVNPGLTAAQIQNVLKQSADDIGAVGWDASYGAGRVNAARAVSLAIAGGTSDTTPPTVGFLSPTGGSTVSGSIGVQVSASDNVGVTSVSFYVDNVLVGSRSTSPYTFTWNSSSVPNGTHTLKATAADAAGNSASAQISSTVSNSSDTSAPSVNITSPSATTRVGNSFSVTASATDNVGVTKVELYIDGALKATDTSSPYSFSVNSRKWASGSHTIYCKAYDAAGNVGVSQTVTVTK